MILLKAEVTPDLRWHQMVQSAGFDGNDLSNGALQGNGVLSLEAVLRGRRLPVALYFDDGDDGDDEDGRVDDVDINLPGPIGSTGSTRSDGSRLYTPAIGCHNNNVGGVGRRLQAHGSGGLQSVTLKVDVGTYCSSGAEEDNGEELEHGTIISPGMLRINVWCSWSVNESRGGRTNGSGKDRVVETVGHNGGTICGGQDGDTSLTGGYSAVGARGDDGDDDDDSSLLGGRACVSLPDVLVASEQVVLVPSQWGPGASGLSMALMDERSSSSMVPPDLDPLESLDTVDLRSCHRSKALADVALVIEAVYSTEGEERRDDDGVHRGLMLKEEVRPR